jgi:hypothetical protein
MGSVISENGLAYQITDKGKMRVIALIRDKRYQFIKDILVLLVVTTIATILGVLILKYVFKIG